MVSPTIDDPLRWLVAVIGLSRPPLGEVASDRSYASPPGGRKIGTMGHVIEAGAIACGIPNCSDDWESIVSTEN